MKWPGVDEVSAGAPLPDGYRCELLTRPDIPSLVAALGD